MVPGRSWTARKHRNERQRSRDDTNEAIAALNALYGADGVEVKTVTAAQEEVQSHLLRQCRIARQDLEDITPEEVACRLLGPRVDYHCENTTVVPYDADQVSLPRLGGKPVPSEAVLDDAAAELVRNFEQRNFAA